MRPRHYCRGERHRRHRWRGRRGGLECRPQFTPGEKNARPPTAVETPNRERRGLRVRAGSMRPRHYCRGERESRRPRLRQRRRLQCGHDITAVENHLWDLTEEAEEALQCGHDITAVENDSAV